MQDDRACPAGDERGWRREVLRDVPPGEKPILESSAQLPAERAESLASPWLVSLRGVGMDGSLSVETIREALQCFVYGGRPTSSNRIAPPMRKERWTARGSTSVTGTTS